MKLSLYPYHLQFKFPFRIAHGARNSTPVVFVKLQYEELTAWGEAALPPYMPETQQTVIEFLTAFAQNVGSGNIEWWFDKLSKVESNLAAKAALDMALWSMLAQMQNKTVGALLGINSDSFPQGTYTLGVSSFNEMKIKIEEAEKNSFEIFKLKWNGSQDEEMLAHFSKLSKRAFAVDVNQGWKSVEEAIEKIQWLQSEQCVWVEQPLPVNCLHETPKIKSAVTLPLFADESCQRISDIEKLCEGFSGINIKLMKCGGMSEALPMIKKARQLGLQVLIGCMSESSVAYTAAAQLSPLADYADLDGPYLITNDPFTGVKMESGKIAVHPLQKLAGDFFD